MLPDRVVRCQVPLEAVAYWTVQPVRSTEVEPRLKSSTKSFLRGAPLFPPPPKTWLTTTAGEAAPAGLTTKSRARTQNRLRRDMGGSVYRGNESADRSQERQQERERVTLSARFRYRAVAPAVSATGIRSALIQRRVSVLARPSIEPGPSSSSTKVTYAARLTMIDSVRPAMSGSSSGSARPASWSARIAATFPFMYGWARAVRLRRKS